MLSINMCHKQNQKVSKILKIKRFFVLDYIIYDRKVVAKLAEFNKRVNIFSLEDEDCIQLDKDGVPYTVMTLDKIKEVFNITDYQEEIRQDLTFLNGTQFVLDNKYVVGYYDGNNVISLTDQQDKILKS